MMIKDLKTYLVGGAVRDRLLGLEPKDKDYVVVGETPTSMKKRGFRRVGADFPVFLHPETHEEYALARTECKSGTGYNGFVTETDGVTLEQDLKRRDLTINAMAMDESLMFARLFVSAATIKVRLNSTRHESRPAQSSPQSHRAS